MGFDIALVRGLGAVAAFDDLIGLSQAGVDVAMAELVAGHDVGRGPFGHGFVGAAFVEDRGAVGDGLVDVRDVVEHLVVDLDRLQRLLGDVARAGGNGGDGVTVIKRLFARHAVVENVGGGIVIGDLSEVGAGDDGVDALDRLGRRRVDGFDAGVGVRAAQHLADQHPRRSDVGTEAGLAGDLVDAIGAQGARADDLELLGVEDLFAVECHHDAFLRSAAVSSTARMILS